MKRWQIHIGGTVQGVGFRPFIYRLACEQQLLGWVCNHAAGVTIEVQGNRIEAFKQRISSQKPPLCVIREINVTPLTLLSQTELEAEYQQRFRIRHSHSRAVKGALSTQVCADFAMCPDCLDDIQNPTSRFYRYPLTNCTHCGPRYTITRTLPYDRANTSMAEFAMCPECERDYHDPSNRRYHAQPIACPKCGPQIRWLAPSTEKRCSEQSFSRIQTFSNDQTYSGDQDYRGDQSLSSDQVLASARSAIQHGEIIAIKGVGGFHLVCDASNSDAVLRLRQLKARPAKPLALMVKDSAQAEMLVRGERDEWQILNARARPITLMQKRSDADTQVASNIAPGVPYLGVMLPYTPLHWLLFESITTPLVFTSANPKGAPIITDSQTVCRQFAGQLGGIVDHPRQIVHPCDDSVVSFTAGQRQILRLGRGYAPYYFALKRTLSTPSLALGAQQKVTLCLGAKNQAVLSPYIGTLDSLEMQTEFGRRRRAFSALHQIAPMHVECDQHPRYASHQWAQTQTIPHTLCAHHHAHILSVMAEYQLDEPVLGMAFDGTGLGEDNQLWGGEILLVDGAKAKRILHLEPFYLLGGEQAVHSPQRLLLSLLLNWYSFEEIQAFNLDAFRALDKQTLANWHTLWQKRINCYSTSSVGRFIDAYCALLTGIKHVEFEGQCGLWLEALALKAKSAAKAPPQFTLSPHDEAGLSLFSFKPMFHRALSALSQCDSPQAKQSCQVELASMLFEQLAILLASLCHRYPNRPLVLAGGVFQNRVLMNAIKRALSVHSTRLYASQTIPLNDGGIAAGQLWLASLSQD